MSVFIIAEAGVNHGGSLDVAMELVNAAKGAGADAVKFQAFTPERLDPPSPRRDMLKGLALGAEDFRAIARHCSDLGIEFMATPFDPDWLAFLVGECGMKRIKIASGQLDNEPLVDAARYSGLPIIFSTGMMGEPEIKKALRVQMGGNEQLLLCTSAYPCPLEDINLAALKHFDGVAVLKYFDGISLHCPVPALGIAAAALGAEVIEMHIKNAWSRGPDLDASLNNVLFGEMVGAIRTVERAMGDGIKRPMPSEAKAIEIALERREWRNASS